MGTTLVKVSPEIDGYLLVNDGYENRVMAWGDEAEIVDVLYSLDERKRDRINPESMDSPEGRIRRAKEYGTSSMISIWDWKDEEIGLESYDTYVLRSDLPEVYRRFDAQDDWPSDEGPLLADLLKTHDRAE